MDFDEEFWSKYAEDNDSKYNEEFSKFIRDLAGSLHCQNILEVGCSTGNDLVSFPKEASSSKVIGIDLCQKAIDKAKAKFPSFDFRVGDATKLPYENSSIDMVFTHRLLNYLDDDELEKSIAEMFRVARKYIVNCELYGKDEEWVDKSEKRDRYRDLFKRWLDYKVKIISNVEMHPEIDPEKTRFTLVRKLE